MRKASTRRRHPMRRLGSVVVNTLLALVTLGALLYIAPSVLGYERYVITGGSMSETIEKGSVVLTEEVPVDELTVGDVVTYLPPSDSGVTTLVTHRIVELGTSDQGTPLFRTQGDANPDPDPWTFSLVAETQPVVRHTVPGVGNVVIALADRGTRMLVVGVPAGLVALLSLAELTSAVRGAVSSRRDRTPSAIHRHRTTIV